MRPRVAYTIAGLSSAVAAGIETWFVGPDVDGAPFVSAGFGAFFGMWIIGSALRGSFQSHREERTPISPRERWIFAGIGTLIVLGFPLLLSLVYEPPR